MSERVYSIDIQLIGTAYIKAPNAQAAREAVDRFIKETGWIEVRGEHISTANFDSPKLPEVSLSTAMTMAGTVVGRRMELDYDPNEEDDDA